MIRQFNDDLPERHIFAVAAADWPNKDAAGETQPCRVAKARASSDLSCKINAFTGSQSQVFKGISGRRS